MRNHYRWMKSLITNRNLGNCQVDVSLQNNVDSARINEMLLRLQFPRMDKLIFSQPTVSERVIYLNFHRSGFCMIAFSALVKLRHILM